jgi:TctA family transporter
MLGFILGPMMEENLRRALLLSRGDPGVFFTSPVSAVMLLMAAALLVIVILPAVSRKRKVVFVEEE